MKLIRIIKAKEIFAPHFQEKLSPSLSYKIYKFCKFAEQEEEFYKQKMREIVAEYAERDENGGFININGQIKLVDETAQEAKQRVIDLETIDVEAPNIKFTLDELSEIKLSVMDIAAIDGFIEEV